MKSLLAEVQRLLSHPRSLGGIAEKAQRGLATDLGHQRAEHLDAQVVAIEEREGLVVAELQAAELMRERLLYSASASLHSLNGAFISVSGTFRRLSSSAGEVGLVPDLARRAEQVHVRDALAVPVARTLDDAVVDSTASAG